MSKRTTTAAGCPNHYSICTGKSGTSGCGGLGEAGTTTEAAIQDHSLNLSASPVLRDSWGVDVTASNVQCSTDAVGVALNGVTILTGAVDGDDCTTFVDVDDITSEWISTLPGTSVRLLQWSYSSVDRFSYRYYVIGATSDLSTLPNNPKPSTAAATIRLHDWQEVVHSLNCYRGYLYSELSAGSTGTAGVTSSYTSTAVAGVTTKYEPSGLCASTDAATNGLCSTSTSSSCNSGYASVGSDGYTAAPTSAPTSASQNSSSSMPLDGRAFYGTFMSCATMLVVSV